MIVFTIRSLAKFLIKNPYLNNRLLPLFLYSQLYLIKKESSQFTKEHRIEINKK